jgi:hypothetical protein
LLFRDRSMVDRVLLEPPVQAPDRTLVFQRWCRQLHTLFKLLRNKVRLAMDNILAHVWSVDNVEVILGSSYVIVEPSSQSVRKDDMSSLLVAA